MDDLLAALGFKQHRLAQFTVAMLIGPGILAVLLLTHALVWRTALGVVSLHIALWVVWFIWLGWWFPASRETRLRTYGVNAYQRAFYTDILPGIWLGFAQLFRPALAALLCLPTLETSLMQEVLALLTMLVGSLLVYLGHHSMDVAMTTFVYEYMPESPAIERGGVYAYISHPMYFGAVLLSFGIGVLAGGVAFWLGLVNLGTLAIYNQIEDRRLSRIFGVDFEAYRRNVGGFLPRNR